MELWHHGGRLGHRLDDVVGERGGVGAGEADPLEPRDRARGPQQLAEGETVAEFDSVGVDVLTQQGDLDGSVVDERLHLGEHVAGPAVLLLAAKRGHDAEGAGVVAADGDGDPPAVGGLSSRGKRGGEDVEGLEDLELGLTVVPRALEQRGQRSHVVGAEHDVDPGRLLEDDRLVLLREAPAHGDLHPGVLPLDGGELAEVAVQPVVGVLAHGAGVDDDDVGLLTLGANVARGFERAAETLGIVHVHLTAVGAHLIGARESGSVDTTVRVGCDEGHDCSSVERCPRAGVDDDSTAGAALSRTEVRPQCAVSPPLRALRRPRDSSRCRSSPCA